MDENEVVRVSEESELEEEPDDVDSNERRLDLVSRRWEGAGESVRLIGPWIHPELEVVKDLLVSNVPIALTEESTKRGVEPNSCSIFLAFRTNCVRC